MRLVYFINVTIRRQRVAIKLVGKKNLTKTDLTKKQIDLNPWRLQVLKMYTLLLLRISVNCASSMFNWIALGLFKDLFLFSFFPFNGELGIYLV